MFYSWAYQEMLVFTLSAQCTFDANRHREKLEQSIGNCEQFDGVVKEIFTGMYNGRMGDRDVISSRIKNPFDDACPDVHKQHIVADAAQAALATMKRKRSI
jgi:hypothetical protein